MCVVGPPFLFLGVLIGGLLSSLMCFQLILVWTAAGTADMVKVARWYYIEFFDCPINK